VQPKEVDFGLAAAPDEAARIVIPAKAINVESIFMI
jgi:hypothetical protein